MFNIRSGMTGEITHHYASAFGLTNSQFIGLDYNLGQINKFYSTLTEQQLKQESEKRAVNLFKLVSRRVPAYKMFLKKHGINPSNIHSYSDLRNVPTIDKKNYLSNYRLNDLCWDGKLSRANFVALSSGSSGKPFFWPRAKNDEIETAIYHEAILENNFSISKRQTLVVCCYALGIYVGCVYTVNVLNKIAERGYRITIISPGIQVDDICMAVVGLKDFFDQVVFMGYPPLIKDVLEVGRDKYKISWDEVPVRFVFSSENFSEEFANYVNKLVGLDASSSVISMYACADAAVIGHGSDLTLLIRQLVGSDTTLNRSLFKENIVPSLHQYNPFSKFLEVIKDEIVITSSGTIPLIRYNIHDRGGVLMQTEAKNIIRQCNYSQDFKSNLGNLPFVYIFGRSDLTATLYGVNIYPENIKQIYSLRNVNDHFTGRFTIQTKNRKDQNQYLLVTLELKKNHAKAKIDIKRIREIIVNQLEQYNLEFRTLRRKIGGKANIRVRVCSYGNPPFKTLGIKNKYVV